MQLLVSLLEKFTRFFTSQAYFLFAVGCTDDCSGHGTCIRDIDGDYYCACSTGWKGPTCSAAVEVQCTDGRDNDFGAYSFFSVVSVRQ